MKTQQQTAKRMSLDNASKGRLEKPMRVLMAGVEGIGKSTFASKAPNPIFLCAEDGTAELDVQRFPEPQSWAEVFEAIDTLASDQHNLQTLVIDSLDWLEPMCWRAVCDKPDPKTRKRYESIEDFGYGRGYTAALDEWRRLAAALVRLRAARGMHVIMIAHTWIKTFKNPEGDDFDRYQLKLHDKAGGFLREWSDAVLFANYETFTHESNGRAKGVSTGARVLHTERCAAWDAKNRYDLPATLPLDWDAFYEAVQAHRPADVSTLQKRIASMLDQASDDIKTRVQAAVKRAGENAAELARIANKLSATINLQENAQ